MDSYVIRIYRRDERNRDKVAGQIELIEQGLAKSFTSAGELVEILGLKEKNAPRNNPKIKAKAPAQKSNKH